jgi:hypothetical protein
MHPTLLVLRTTLVSYPRLTTTTTTALIELYQISAVGIGMYV